MSASTLAIVFVLTVCVFVWIVLCYALVPIVIHAIEALA